MRRTCASLVALVGSLLAISGNGNAETRTISWTPVTTYADGTAIEPSMTVTYDIYWTMDPGLSVSSLKSVATSVARTSAVFDPDALGMPRGQTVYFTGDAVLLTGAASSLARATPWTVMAGSIVLPAPQNVALTGPMAAAPSKTFRLKWDPVTARADGGAIPAGEVRYTPYWSSDPNFPAAALRLLATPTAGTSVDFDPAVAGMGRNQRVYFTVKAWLPAGDQSPLSPGATWVSNNTGPAAPGNAKVVRK